MFFSYKSHIHNVLFREPDKEDLSYYLEIRNNTDIQFLLCVPNPTIQTTNNVKLWLERKKNEDDLLFTTIIDKSTKKFLGYLQIKDIDKSLKVGTVGICLHPGNVGQGYGTESLSLLHDYVQNNTNLHILRAEILTRNLQSINLFRKCGYTINLLDNKYFEQSGIRYPLCECNLHLSLRQS